LLNTIPNYEKHSNYGILRMNQNKTQMKFIKEKDDDRRDYIFQKDNTTVIGVILVSSVIVFVLGIVAMTYFNLG
jgi:hypothetical protein